MSITTPAAGASSHPLSHPLSHLQEIRLISAREFKNQMTKKPWLISVLVMLAVLVGGIIGYNYLTGGNHHAYRVAVAGAAPSDLPGLEQVTDSKGTASCRAIPPGRRPRPPWPPMTRMPPTWT